MRKDFYEVDPNAWLFKTALPNKNASDKEEAVRQWALHELIRAYGISICDISLECPVKFGHKTLRADIAVLQRGKPYIIVECKKHSHKEHAGALKQACSYADSLGGSVHFVVYTNGEKWHVSRKWQGEWVPVSDIPSFHLGSPSVEWDSIHRATLQLAPVLYWLDKPVPAKYARVYFVALQEFFHPGNEALADTDINLISAIDNSLRVLRDIHDHPGYRHEKVAAAYKALGKYWAKHNFPLPIAEKLSWRDMVQAAWGVLPYQLERSADVRGMDYATLHVVLVLLGYILRLHPIKMTYTEVGPDMQGALRECFDLGLTVRFHAGLPDVTDRPAVASLQASCKAQWDDFLKRNTSWPQRLLSWCAACQA